MNGFQMANLDLMLSEIGEDNTKKILAEYSCPLNADIEDFFEE